MMQHDLSQVLSKDRYFLYQAHKQPHKFGGMAKVKQKYQQSHQRYQQRLSALPRVHLNTSLPVYEKAEIIKETIKNHQVTIICGETGSGKTTQLPQLCLEIGRGVAGLIGHTQPRRLAARAVAERIAEELQSEIGQHVGFKVRFNDKTAPHSFIKVMTDGILLAESQHDRFLSAYDTIIIDEAHERSLNIDFLLGFLKQLLPKRPDLKVIITSATLDAEQFSQHFNHAPVIEVSGRTFPVDILYRPLHNQDEDEAEMEMADAIVDAVDELARLGQGDVLVFLAGEREIREAEQALRKSPLRQHDEILPLFARLSQQEQHKIFHPTGNTRRIILATNVAETSLTVPRIKFVVDTGLARVKRYSARAKVEQLHVEKIAQSSAKQRAGRCGRTAAGVCIRLFSEEDFANRAEFTDPEIIRSNLAGVVLRSAYLGLGDLSVFPFIQAPEIRYINDAYQVLQELNAVTPNNALTALGKEMAKLPIDPKISRILLASVQHDCVAEALIIVSALSIQDPRERPLDVREYANKAHERFTDKQSDFLTYLNIWDSFQKERDKGLSNKQLVQWCRQYFLSHLRMREWRELHGQLAQMMLEMGLTTPDKIQRTAENLSVFTQTASTQDADLSAKIKQKQLDKKQHRNNIKHKKAASYEQIHRALLKGLIAHVGMKSPERHDYIGARGSHFHLFPASSLFKTKPKWVMAAELTETSKLYARDVASIQPEWIEQETPHLVRYHYFEPHWEQKRGEVLAMERVTLYGLTVLPRRATAYAKVAPEEARELFIRGALVNQECDSKADFFLHNKKLIREIIELENKSRKQDVLIDDEALFEFYHQRLPQSYTNPNKPNKATPLADLRTLDAWLKTADENQIKALFLTKEDLMQHTAAHITEEQFPKYWKTADGKFKLSYRFEPHHIMDGITLTLPLTVLNRINANSLEWLVQGMIREKLTLLIKALPKQIRRVCVPVPEFITHFLNQNPDTQSPILPQLAHAIAKHAGDMRLLEQIKLDEWQAVQLPEHCYFNLKIIDDGGQELAMGRNLIQLQQQLGQAAAVTFRDNTQEFEREHLTTWDIGTLPESLKFARGKQQLTGYLGLQKEKNGIALRLFDTDTSAEHAHRIGVIELMKLQLKEQVKDLNKGLLGFTQIAMNFKHIPAEALREDITHAVCNRAFIGEDALPRDEKAFKEQIKRARSRLPAVKEAMSRYLQELAQVYAELNSKLGKHPLTPILRNQLNQLIYQGFISQIPWQQWQRMTVYLHAMLKRMEKYSANPTRDQMREDDIQELYLMWQEKVNTLKTQGKVIPENLAQFYWQLQELRVSLFAQELKTPYPVSVKRLMKEWESLGK